MVSRLSLIGKTVQLLEFSLQVLETSIQVSAVSKVLPNTPNVLIGRLRHTFTRGVDHLGGQIWFDDL